MKNILPVALFHFACLAPASALTEADLTPAALAGKTLTFTIGTSAAPFATSGSWTGKFETSPANGFTVVNVSGNTVNISATRTFNSSFSGLYEYTVSPFIAGQPDAVMTLWVSEGGGRYEIFLTGLFENSQTGSFTIGAPLVKSPEIAVAQPATKNLTDGKATAPFGTIKIGKSSMAKTFTIRNTGKANLTGLALKKTGTNKGDFVVGALAKTTLAPGAKTTFTVKFKPGAKGTKSATLQIKSNDANENPFDIKLTGTGTK